MKSILFLGYNVTDECVDKLISIDTLPALQTIKLSRGLYEIFNRDPISLSCFTVVPIQDFPIGKKLYVKGNFGAGVNTKGVSFINVLCLKQISRFFSILFHYVNLKSRPDFVFIHGCDLSLISSVFVLKLLFPNVHVQVVLTDMASLPLASDGLIRRCLKIFSSKLTKLLLKRFDSCVSLSRDLGEYYFSGKRIISLPGVVVPGDNSVNKMELSIDSNVFNHLYSSSGKHKILYAGTIIKSYGVESLIESLDFLDDSFVIYFFGKGPDLDYLKAVAKKDSRVVYGGFLNKAQLDLFIENVDVLVNCRSSNLEFSKLSFPSKLLEYSLSGKPVITSRIETIPDELAGYFLYFNDQTALEIANEIKRFFKLSEVEREMVGAKLKDFVVNTYSPSAIFDRYYNSNV
ncbi:glycosyltransferase [Shewanella gelidii]|uniref:Glycosyl transferase family 1 domain-containing protein n=1 Tax=Shewanella gelidii TaxID=1642821 RepID=A0A917N5N1_9GAMM|nr:glycosyltransferase [Shewanella gelidii]MCL1096425.1 glycosyltransferase [Shewanella gelidii]GGI67301.1 hypothetical protein GCM10009332_00530 [Shewanella gelidii]